MKVLRLKLYQQTACYKKPFAFKVAETYPLPPHSTVKGMLHAVLESTAFVPMQISIQGDYDTLIHDYQTHYFFKESDTSDFVLTTDGLGFKRNLEDLSTMPIYTHMLYDVNLLIHVQAEPDVLDQLEDRINSNSMHLSLGRWEDLVQLKEPCEQVELVQATEDLILPYNAYVPKDFLELDQYGCYPYRLNWKYEIVNGVRVWEKFRVGYIQAGEAIGYYDYPYMIDTDQGKKYGVFFPTVD